MRFRSRVASVVGVLGLVAGTVTAGSAAVSAAPAEGSASSVSLVTDPAAHVNPFIGTGSGGQVVGDVDTFPGADDPFGMIQWSPDTSPDRTDGGGYYYSDKQILGFSLTHLSGPGCPALGDVPILPTVGSIGTTPEATTEPFSHSTEKASPGFYQVTTGATGAKVTTKLAVTTRTGIGTFTYPSGTTSNLLIKAGDSANGETTSTVQIIGDNEIEGSVTAGQFCGATDKYTLHFIIKFEHPFSSEGSWDGSKVTAGPTSSPVTAADAGAYVTFDTKSAHTVTAKVGISYVSEANAILNLKTEDSGWNFGAVRSAATSSWNKLLDKVQIGGGSAAQQANFYTALYHSLLHPNIFSDVNGQYMGDNGKVQTVAAGHANYANYSGWDIYRSQIPLASLVDPSAMSDMAKSVLADYAQTGEMPKWSLNNGESYVMVGDPSDGILADAYAFGARDFDTSTALKDMVAEATKTNDIRPGLNYLESMGYLPVNGTYNCCNFYGPVSTTLEYDTADSAIANLAQAVGAGATYTKFATRAQDWENLYNPTNGFIEPKMANGSWVSDFDPTSEDNYVEGDAYQYNWMVPFNVGGLVNAEGGDAAFDSRLATYFTQLNAGPSSPYDWAGNEPSLADAWEFDYAGAPYETQDAVRRIITQTYHDAPGGEPGNDDLGAMASWYVWAALGFFPENPGSNDLVYGSPLFPKEIVHFGSGKELVVNATGAKAADPYIESATVNGKASDRDWLSAANLVSGSGSGKTTIDFTMGAAPNKSWGSAAADEPPSDGTGEQPAVATLKATQLDVAPGGSANAQVTVRNVTDHTEKVKLSATPTTGLTVSPKSTTLTLGPAAKATATIGVSAASDAPQNFSTVPVAVSVGGTIVSTHDLTVLVAPVHSLPRYYNEEAVSSDSNPDAADIDGDGNSYSSQALAAAGVTPGSSVRAGGITYTWPESPAGDPDSILAEGQTIPVAAAAGDAQLGFLGTATDGPASGIVTLHYTDGTSTEYQLGLSDWTLNAGSSTASYGNAEAIKTTYRNTGDGSQDVATYVFGTAIPLDTSKTLKSVTLPFDVGDNLHVFDMLATTTAATGPVAESISPTTAVAGDTVTITGTGFGSTQGSGYVQFSDDGTNWGSPSNSATLDIKSWSNTAVSFVVPDPSGTDDEWAVTPGTLATASVTTSAGDTSDAAVLAITPSSDQADYYDNVAVSSDGTACSTANADGDDYSYSAQALAKDGITPGSTITAQGLSYTFPDVQPCNKDNILADGQTILINGTSSDTKLGILGMSSNGPVTEPITITYTDGSTSTADVTLNDWAGGPGSGDVSVATMPYRNYYNGSSQTIQMWLYSTTVSLTAGKTVASVTLPDIGTDVSNAAFHIFDITAGS